MYPRQILCALSRKSKALRGQTLSGPREARWSSWSTAGDLSVCQTRLACTSYGSNFRRSICQAWSGNPRNPVWSREQGRQWIFLGDRPRLAGNSCQFLLVRNKHLGCLCARAIWSYATRLGRHSWRTLSCLHWLTQMCRIWVAWIPRRPQLKFRSPWKVWRRLSLLVFCWIQCQVFWKAPSRSGRFSGTSPPCRPLWPVGPFWTSLWNCISRNCL